jgi:hypothetical protein
MDCNAYYKEKQKEMRRAKGERNIIVNDSEELVITIITRKDHRFYLINSIPTIKQRPTSVNNE